MTVNAVSMKKNLNDKPTTTSPDYVVVDPLEGVKEAYRYPSGERYYVRRHTAGERVSGQGILMGWKEVYVVGESIGARACILSPEPEFPLPSSCPITVKIKWAPGYPTIDAELLKQQMEGRKERKEYYLPPVHFSNEQMERIVDEGRKFGYEVGELCNRKGCGGSLMYTSVYGHRDIERQRTFCPACGWDSLDLK